MTAPNPIAQALEESLAIRREREDPGIDHTDGTCRCHFGLRNQTGERLAMAAQMDEDAAATAEAHEARRQRQVDTFGLENCEVGSIVWSKAQRGTDGTAAHGGMVVGTGIDDRGEQYLLVLDESAAKLVVTKKTKDSKAQPTRVGVARLRRMYVADVDPATVMPPDSTRMHGWARKAFVAAGVGATGRAGYVTDEDVELARIGLALVEESHVRGGAA